VAPDSADTSTPEQLRNGSTAEVDTTSGDAA
jgi:hypothetical protein